MTWLQAGADSIGMEVVVFLLACALSGSQPAADEVWGKVLEYRAVRKRS